MEAHETTDTTATSPGTLVDTLGYRYRKPNLAQRAMQHVAASRPGAWVFKRTLHPIDKLLFKVTGGRITVPGLVAGLPVIMVTTTGAKSGKARTMPLLGIPMDGDIAIIGSNFGQKGTPGWVYNLRADPTAVIGYRGTTTDVSARLGTDAEADAAFAEAATVYPGYAKYRQRAHHRTIQVYVLTCA